MPADQPALLVSIEAAVGTMTLNRPRQPNALNAELMFGLLVELERLMTDPDVRVVTITGSGRAFCAGGDVNGLDEVVGQGVGPGPARRLREVAGIVELLYYGPKPSIAVVNGACAGAGLGIAAAADIRIASSSAIFTTAFLSIGLAGDFGGAWLLTRLVGEGRARELYLDPRRISAEEALRLGLVSTVVPDSELTDAAHQLSHRLSGYSALAIEAIRENFREVGDRDLSSYLRGESLRQVRTQASPESRAAVAAFREPRSPGSRVEQANQADEELK